MSGVDPLVCAAWVGHSDGGILIFKTYGHLCSSHRKSSAKKLVFDQGAKIAPVAVGNLIDPTKLTTAELINLLHRSQQETGQPLAA